MFGKGSDFSLITLPLTLWASIEFTKNMQSSRRKKKVFILLNVDLFMALFCLKI